MKLLSSLVSATLVIGLQGTVLAQGSAPAGPERAGEAVETEGELFAVEVRVGPAWDKSLAPSDQKYFREHSASLRKLREQGSLVLGARYGDKGLVVLRAQSEKAAREMMEEDPSIKHGVFSYEMHKFSVFYGGAVQARQRQR